MSHQRSHYLILAAGLAALFTALALAGCGGGGAAAKSTTGSITGVVRDADTLAGIAGAAVAVPPTAKTATTSSSGGFTVTGVRPGIYTVTASGSGYTHGSASATVTAGAATTISITVEPTAAPTSVGAAGGTVQDTGPSGEEAAVEIPGGALGTDTDIAVTALPAAQAPPSPNGDPNHVAGQFDPDGQTFAASVNVTVPTPGAMTPGASVPLYEWTADGWTEEATATVDAGGHTATASVTHFCVYAVIAQKAVSSWPSVGIAAAQIHEVVVQTFQVTDPASVDDMYGIALASDTAVVSGAIYWLRYSERPRYPNDPERTRIDDILTLLEQALAHNQGGGGGG